MSSNGSDIIGLTVDPKDLSPQTVLDDWLPNEEKSILFLFHFKKYPPHESHYIIPSDLQPFLHQDPIQPFKYHSFLQIGPPTLPSVRQAYQDAIKKSQSPILSITLPPNHGNPVVLPTWIFQYWTEIRCAVDTRKQWKTVLM